MKALTLNFQFKANRNFVSDETIMYLFDSDAFLIAISKIIYKFLYMEHLNLERLFTGMTANVVVSSLQFIFNLLNI